MDVRTNGGRVREEAGVNVEGAWIVVSHWRGERMTRGRCLSRVLGRRFWSIHFYWCGGVGDGIDGDCRCRGMFYGFCR